ncbi:MAG: hypothetical protein Q9215_001172 [Flavoplaca cf. flavocitrina]
MASTVNDGARPISASTTKDETSSSESNVPATKARKIGKPITANACTNCKKARAKRCRSRPVTRPCQYVLHTKALKEQLMREIQRLQDENQSLTTQNSSLGDKNIAMEGILQCLKDDEQIGAIVSRLVHGDSQQAISDCLVQAPVGYGAPPAALHQLDGALENLPQQWDATPEILSLMLHLEDPDAKWEPTPNRTETCGDAINPGSNLR